MIQAFTAEESRHDSFYYQTRLINKIKEMVSAGSEPGCHGHHGNCESCCVLKRTGVYDDNGAKRAIGFGKNCYQSSKTP